MILAITLPETLMVALLCLMSIVLIGIVAVLHKLFAKTAPIKPSTPKTHISIKSASLYDTEIYRVVKQIQQEVNASKVIIARFHNGGVFRNGLDMEKFSITHETPLGSDFPLQDKCVAVLNSRYASAFLHLATCGDYCISDIEDCPDPNFKQDMRHYGFKSTYLFLIKQFDGSDEGFIGLNFRETKVLNQEQRNKVENHIPRLLGLLNMRESDLKEKYN